MRKVILTTLILQNKISTNGQIGYLGGKSEKLDRAHMLHMFYVENCMGNTSAVPFFMFKNNCPVSTLYCKKLKSIPIGVRPFFL